MLKKIRSEKKALKRRTRLIVDYQTEKTLKELGDKIDPADKSNIEVELNNKGSCKR